MAVAVCRRNKRTAVGVMQTSSGRRIKNRPAAISAPSEEPVVSAPLADQRVALTVGGWRTRINALGVACGDCGAPACRLRFARRGRRKLRCGISTVTRAAAPASPPVPAGRPGHHCGCHTNFDDHGNSQPKRAGSRTLRHPGACAGRTAHGNGPWDRHPLPHPNHSSWPSRPLPPRRQGKKPASDPTRCASGRP